MNRKNCSVPGGLPAANLKKHENENDPNSNETTTTTLAQMSTGTAILVTHDACSCHQSHSTQRSRQVCSTNARVSKRQSRLQSRLRISENEHAPKDVTERQSTVVSCLRRHARHAGKPTHAGSKLVGASRKWPDLAKDKACSFANISSGCQGEKTDKSLRHVMTP
jgi:hypothetical protein